MFVFDDLSDPISFSPVVAVGVGPAGVEVVGEVLPEVEVVLRVKIVEDFDVSEFG